MACAGVYLALNDPYDGRFSSSNVIIQGAVLSGSLFVGSCYAENTKSFIMPAISTGLLVCSSTIGNLCKNSASFNRQDLVNGLAGIAASCILYVTSSKS